MHHAWYIDDVRYLIFEYLDRRDLGRLAQTCKSLSDIATDELWKHNTSMASFLSCLPPDYRSRPLRAEDIQRLDYYGSKVEKITMETKDVTFVIRLPRQFISQKMKREQKGPMKSWKELWAEIAELRPASKFLPNLRSIRFSNISEELLFPLIGISGSNLTSIYIRYIHHDAQPKNLVHKFLDELQDYSKLEYLFVRDGEPDIIPLKIYQQAPLKHLRLDPRIHAGRHQDYQFKQYPLRAEILRKSTLENLTLPLTPEWYGDGIKTLDKKYLPALRTLWLNLTTFKPQDCRSGCTNKNAHSWLDTCSNTGHDCAKRSPALFLKGLDNPELDLLNIKFPAEGTRRMFMDVVTAAKDSCRLKNLSELALAGGGWFNNCGECGKREAPKIEPADLRKTMTMFLPLPQLKTLRLSVAPNFLDVLDLDMYKSMTDGMPALEKLLLGHWEFRACSYFEGETFYERVPLHHLAAFCNMLPNLVEVNVGTLDGMTLEEQPRLEWQCPGVKSLSVHTWAHGPYPARVSRDLLHLGVRSYFPNSDLAQHEYDPRTYFFT